MQRRYFLSLAAAPLFADSRATVRGRLTQATSETLLTLDGGRVVKLAGDEATLGVLRDARLKNADFEAAGRFTGPNEFAVDLIHTRSLFAHVKGRKLMVTYWCDICYIRTFTPGVCWCCQEDTALDLREPDAPDPVP